MVFTLYDREFRISLDELYPKNMNVSRLMKKYHMTPMDFTILRFKEAETIEESDFLMEVASFLSPDLVVSIGLENDGECQMFAIFDSCGNEIDLPKNITDSFETSDELFLRIFSSFLFEESLERGLTTIRFVAVNDDDIIMDVFNPPNGKKLFTKCISTEEMMEFDFQTVMEMVS